MIRVRAPWRYFAELPMGDRILSMIEWRPPRLGYPRQVLALGSGGDLFAVTQRDDPLGGTNDVVQLSNALTPNYAADFVRFGAWIYVLNGGADIWKTDGAFIQRVGIPAPLLSNQANARLHVHSSGTVGTPGGGQYTAEYAVTFYNSNEDVESNPSITIQYVRDTSGAGNAVTFTVLGGGSPGLPEPYGITHVRIYRRSVSLSEPGYQFLGQVVTAPPNQTFTDNIINPIPASISSSTAGPFAPSRNGIPRFATCGALYKSRLFVNRTDQPGRVYFSSLERPDYVDEDDYIDVSGDSDDRVRGLAVLGDVVAVGKRAALWTIAGDIAGATNLTNATGALPLESNVRVLRITEHNLGPVQEAGNGFLVGGSPSRIYFAGDAGACVFDGVTPRILSGPIAPTWENFIGPIEDANVTRAVSIAEDRHDGTIWFACTNQATNPDPPQDELTPILIYHYELDRNRGLGGWTTFDAGGLSRGDHGLVAGGPTAPNNLVTISCVARRTEHQFGIGGDVDDDLRAPSPLIGCSIGLILKSQRYNRPGATGGQNDAVDQRVPDFLWVSGDIEPFSGFESVLNWVKWFFADLGDAAILTGNPWLFTVQADRTSERSIKHDVTRTHPTHRIQPVRKRARKWRLLITRDPSFLTGWQEGAGVVGVEFDFEKVGQR